MPPDRWRLFVAAPLPEDAAAEAWRALAPLRELHPNVRWLPAGKLHLTLVFLGTTDVSDVPRIAAAVASVAAAQHPIAVATGKAGGRIGGRRGGVAWLRLHRGHGRVAQLSREIDIAIGSNLYGSGIAPRPHLTVARGVTEEALADLSADTIAIDLHWLVDRIALVRSHTGPAGSHYEELADAHLTGGTLTSRAPGA